MRLFVAAVPPPAVLAPLAVELPTLKERWPNIGWIPPERWHLTLCFLGEVDDPLVAALSSGLATVASSAPVIPATVGVGGTFPGGRRPRVAWVGVNASEELPALAAAVTAVAADAGCRVDDRRYRPHITLGRVRREPVADPDDLRALLGVAAGGQFVIGRLVLFRSHLGPKPRYEEVAAWPLVAK